MILLVKQKIKLVPNRNLIQPQAGSSYSDTLGHMGNCYRDMYTSVLRGGYIIQEEAACMAIRKTQEKLFNPRYGVNEIQQNNSISLSALTHHHALTRPSVVCVI